MWPSSDPVRRRAIWYTAAALFCALFAWVYEQFSHGVWSYAMVFAFAYPLSGGTLCCLLINRERPAGAALWRAGIATLTVGSLFRGALEIYGTSHRLTVVYPIAGTALCAAGAMYFLFDVLHVSRYNKNRVPSD
ncbi:MAG: hypothetical protein IJ157_07345 [Clostridia bacterium]|nr:hypothetical protein [Clostridia bacterium]